MVTDDLPLYIDPRLVGLNRLDSVDVPLVLGDVCVLSCRPVDRRVTCLVYPTTTCMETSVDTFLGSVSSHSRIT